MIKVNLKNTKTAISRFSYSETTSATGASTAASTQLSSFLKQLQQLDLSSLDTAVLLRIMIKFILVCAIPFSLKIYEIINIEKLKNSIKQVETNVASTNSARDQIQVKIKNYDYLKKKEEEFNRKKELLSGLASSRLVIPRFLDEIQTAIPPSVWLKEMEVSAPNPRENKRQVKFAGEGLNEELINSFVEELKIFVDANSLRLNTRDIKEGEISVKVKFDIQAELYD